jgi:hypothetical protein
VNVLVWCGAVEGLFVSSGADFLQNGNKTSLSGVCCIVSLILHNDNLTQVSFDHEPSACVAHEAWRREGLPVPPESVVGDGWLSVLKHLRQVCVGW